MRIVISSDKKGLELKNRIVEYLRDQSFEVEDLTPQGDVDFYEASIKVVNEVLKDVKANGEDVACRIANRFCVAQYSGGRHQIRVDMLNKMC